MAAAIRINPGYYFELKPEDKGLTHVKILNCEFDGNGSTDGAGTIDITFWYDSDLYSILIENNVVLHNASHLSNSAIINIKNIGNIVTPD